MFLDNVLNKSVRLFFLLKIEETGILQDFIFPRNILNNTPRRVAIKYTKENLKRQKTDSLIEKSFKFRRNLFKSYKYKVHFRDLVKTKTELQTYQNTYQYLKDSGLLNVQFILETQSLIDVINNIFITLTSIAEKGELNDNIIDEKHEEFLKKISGIEAFSNNILKTMSDNFYHNTKINLNKVSARLNSVNSNRYVVELNHNKKIVLLKKSFKTIPEVWINNDILLNNALSTEIRLYALESRIKTLINDFTNKTSKQIKNVFIDDFEAFNNYLQNLDINSDAKPKEYSSKLDEV